MARTQTQTDSDQTQLLLQGLYDALMQSIEPELTSEMIPQLKEIYEFETQEESKERATHYEWAYKQFLELWHPFVEQLMELAKGYEQDVIKQFTIESEKEDTQKLESLEGEIENV